MVSEKCITFAADFRKVGRVIDRAGLEIRYTPFGYRGFESLTFRKQEFYKSHCGTLFLRSCEGFKPQKGLKYFNIKIQKAKEEFCCHAHIQYHHWQCNYLSNPLSGQRSYSSLLPQLYIYHQSRHQSPVRRVLRVRRHYRPTPDPSRTKRLSPLSSCPTETIIILKSIGDSKQNPQIIIIFAVIIERFFKILKPTQK